MGPTSTAYSLLPIGLVHKCHPLLRTDYRVGDADRAAHVRSVRRGLQAVQEGDASSRCRSFLTWAWPAGTPNGSHSIWAHRREVIANMEALPVFRRPAGRRRCPCCRMGDDGAVLYGRAADPGAADTGRRAVVPPLVHRGHAGRCVRPPSRPS